MPTDGTLLLEHMPNGKQYLVTALSVFFSIGSVVSAVIGLIVIPPRSCPPAPDLCDVATQNTGWKHLLVALGLLVSSSSPIGRFHSLTAALMQTLAMFTARIVFFRLHESPRYLVHAGRPHEAIESLQMISKFNGSELSLDLEDVYDHRQPTQDPPPNGESSSSSGPTRSSPPRTVADVVLTWTHLYHRGHLLCKPVMRNYVGLLRVDRQVIAQQASLTSI